MKQTAEIPWASVAKELVGKPACDPYSKEREYARQIFPSILAIMPTTDTSPTSADRLITQAFTYSWSRHGRMRGCVNVTPIVGLSFLPCYIKGFCDYIGVPCAFASALAVSADQLDSWSRDGGAAALLREDVIVLTDVDDVMIEYRLLCGLAKALEKADRANQFILLCSKFPLREYATLVSNSGHVLDAKGLRITYQLDSLNIIKESLHAG